MTILVLFIFAALAVGLANASVGGGRGTDSAPSPLFGDSMKFSTAQIAQYARGAGFTGSALATAIAVAIAESGGDPNAYNPETAANTPEGMGSYGLWQIYLNAHPEYSDSDMFDPQTNAEAAYRIYQQSGYNFKPWSTFKNSAYTAHLADAQRYA